MPTLSRRIRKHERTFFYVITGIIAVSFFFWGTPGGGPGESQGGGEVGSIAGQPVTRAEITGMAYRVDIVAILDAFGRSPVLGSPYGRRQWLQYLVRAKQSMKSPEGAFFLMYLGLGDIGDLSRNDTRDALAWKWLAYLRAADRAGIQVSTPELTRFIRTLVGVPEEGAFPADQYRAFVQSDKFLHMEVTQFEKAIEEYLKTQKYFAAVGEAAEVTSEELLNAYLEENREVELAWLAFDPSAVPATPPAREAVARYFQENKGQFKLPAKAQVEYLLADREKYVGEVEAPSEADVKTYYEARKTMDFKNPGGGKDGKPEFKPLEGEVRDQIVLELKKQRASLKASDILQKLLSGKDGIGDIEVRMKKDPSVKLDFAELAAKNGVTHGVSNVIPESQVDELEKLFGAFRDPRDKDSFRRKVFQDMNDGEVMRGEQRPLATDKGWLIYRLVSRKKERTPDQLTSDVEEEIVARLRKEAQDRKVQEEAKRAVDLVNAQGLAAAEAELHRVFNRPPALKASMPLPDPAGGEHGRLADGSLILNLAFTLRAGNQVGKGQILDPGTSRTKYAVVLQRALEAKMDEFEAQKTWLREKLMQNGFDGGAPVPGKRQKLINARRAELEKGIVRKDVAEPKPGETSPDAPPMGGMPPKAPVAPGAPAPEKAPPVPAKAPPVPPPAGGSK